ncbi:putative membrane protein YgcG [Cryobacterium sp. MP_3.1]|nr:putative membrane protein YgcG [Cryobacterium sp. MP_3.1]
MVYPREDSLGQDSPGAAGVLCLMRGTPGRVARYPLDMIEPGETMTHRQILPRRRALAAALATALTLAGACAASASAPAASVPADASDFTFDSFTVDYDLGRDADGRATLRTVETIVADFPAGDQNRGIVRAIPDSYRYVDMDVQVISVTDETGAPVPYETSSRDDFTELALGTDDFVHGRTTYVLEYTQRDVIGDFADTAAEEFYWDVNGTGWAQPFGSVTARLHLDEDLTAALTGEAACYVGYYGGDATCAVETSTDAAGSVLTSTSQNLVSGQNMSVAIGFVPGTFTQPPGPEESWIVTVAPWLILGFAAFFVLMLLGLRTFVWRDARGRGTIVVQYTPPEELSVMLAAAMLGKKKVGLPAQVISFAVTRAARLVESPSEPASRRYALEVVDTHRLSSADRQILAALVPKLKGGARLRLDTADPKLGDRLERLRGSISDEVTSSGYRARGTSRIPTYLALAGALLLAPAWLVTRWAGQNEVSSTLVGWLMPGTILALVLLGVMYQMPHRLTEKGAANRDYLLGLRDYLALAEADRIRVLQSPEGAERVAATIDTDLIVKLHEKLLPWAMLWGVEREWARELGTYYDTTDASPDWFSGAGGAAMFSQNFTGFAGSIGTGSFATTPSESSSSGSSWSGSDGSSSSGGSSGGGFSGGGGGGGGGDGR